VENFKNDRIERYVYQVMRLLPGTARGDIEKELRTLISDMLEERCKGREPKQKDIDIVLIELGPPDELAANYVDQNRYLVGPALFPKYIFLLKIMLACVLGGITIAMIVQAVFNAVNDGSWIGFFASWFATLLSGMFGAFSAVTLIFAVIENRDKITSGSALEKVFDEIKDEIDSKESGGSFLDRLPAVPEKRAEIKRPEPMGGIVFGTLILLLFIFSPQVLGIYLPNESGQWVRAATIFDLDVLQTVIYPIAIAIILGIVRDTVKLIEGRYTNRLAVATVACDIPALLLSVFILTKKGLFTDILPAIASVNKQVAVGLSEIRIMFDNFHIFILVVVVFAHVLNIATTIFKTIKYSEQ